MIPIDSRCDAVKAPLHPPLHTTMTVVPVLIELKTDAVHAASRHSEALVASIAAIYTPGVVPTRLGPPFTRKQESEN